MVNRTNGYEPWGSIIDAHTTEENAAAWQYFWNFQEPLSDQEFGLLKEMCYAQKSASKEHDLLVKLVNREMTLRIKCKCSESEQEALAV